MILNNFPMTFPSATSFFSEFNQPPVKLWDYELSNFRVRGILVYCCYIHVNDQVDSCYHYP